MQTPDLLISAWFDPDFVDFETAAAGTTYNKTATFTAGTVAGLTAGS